MIQIIKNKFQNKGFDRNYFAMLFEGASFMGGISVMATSGAVALFIDRMTGSVTLVGLAVTLQALCMLIGQLIGAPYVQSIRNLPKTLFVSMTWQRLIPFVMSIPLFIGAGAYTAVGIFLLLFGIFWLFDGIITMPWSELTARTINAELRGHMMGMQVAIGGIVSLLTGLLLTWLLAAPVLTDHFRFGYIFVLTSALLMLSVIFIRLVKDPKPIEKPIKPEYKQYYSKLPLILKENKSLQRALLARIPGYIGFSVITFMVVFGVHALDITDVQVSWIVYFKIIGGLVGGILLGETSRRLGNRLVILMCNAGVLLTIVMAAALLYSPGLGYMWLIIICVSASLWQNNWLGYMSYIFDIAPREYRPAFVVIGNCIGIPFSFTGYAIGAVIDKWGYPIAFTIGGITAVITILASTRLMSKKQIKELNINT